MQLKRMNPSKLKVLGDRQVRRLHLAKQAGAAWAYSPMPNRVEAERIRKRAHAEAEAWARKNKESKANQ